MNTFSINPNTSFLDVVFQMMAFHRDTGLSKKYKILHRFKYVCVILKNEVKPQWFHLVSYR